MYAAHEKLALASWEEPNTIHAAYNLASKHSCHTRAAGGHFILSSVKFAPRLFQIFIFKSSRSQHITSEIEWAFAWIHLSSVSIPVDTDSSIRTPGSISTVLPARHFIRRTSTDASLYSFRSAGLMRFIQSGWTPWRLYIQQCSIQYIVIYYNHG